MGAVVAEITISVDGYVAGPNPSLEEGLGENGERLHEWATSTASWREAHGKEAGDVERVLADDLIEAGRAAGATVMGRRMYSGGEGPWEDDPNAAGWWGDTPPFGHPVYVLTHHAREPVEMKGGTTFHFVTDGVESAVEQAQAAAGDRRVTVAGGGEAIRQALAAGLVDELIIHVAPILLGGGTPLFVPGEGPAGDLDLTRVLRSPAAAHLRFRLR